MKFILTVLLLGCISAHAQKKPSQAQINQAKQMQAQAQQQMERELKELEQDDPEMARQVRNMMKGKALPPQQYTVAKVATPKLNSPIEMISFKGKYTTPSAAEAKDHLLWYKGKKLNDSLLVTTSGSLVLLSRNKNKLVVQPDVKKDGFGIVVKELAKNEQAKVEFINAVAARKNIFFFYPAVMLSVKEWDRIGKIYGEAVKNAFDLPSLNNVNATSHSLKKNGSLAAATFLRWQEIPEEVRRLHSELIAALEKKESLDFPPPPEREFDLCFHCDSNAQKNYDRQRATWSETFKKYESDLIRKSLAVSKALVDINSPDAEKINDDMARVQQFAFARTDKKIAALLQQYGKDFTRLPSIIPEVIGMERQKQLLGTGEENTENLHTILTDLFQEFDRYLEDQMNRKNYSVVLNMFFVVGMERQKQLLGAGEDGLHNYLDKLQAFNRFALNMSMDFEIVGKDEDGPFLNATGNMATPKKAYVSLGMLDCKYQLFLTETNYGAAEENDYRILMQVNSGTKKIKEKKEWKTYSYSGPKDLLAVFPPFKIDFCNNSGSDSVYLQIVTYKPETMTSFSASSVTNAYTIDFLAYANNLFMAAQQLEGAADDAKNLALKYMQTASSSQVTRPTGNAALDRMQNDYNMVVKSAEYQDNMSKMAMLPKTLVLFDAQNNSSVLIDAETNTAHEINDDMSLTKGIIKIKVVHDPLPYQSSPTRKPLKKS